MKRPWSRALIFPLLLAAALPARAVEMQSATNVLYPGDMNSSGEDDLASNTNYTLGDALGEAVVGPRANDGTYQVGDGLRQIMAYPNAVTTLAAQAGAGGGPATLSWSAPGYDGNDGALQAGTSYYVALATYAVASPFNSFNGLLMTVSTSGVVAGTAQQMTVPGLASNTTYFVQIWTVDADGDSALASNVASFTTLSAAITNFLAVGGLKQAMLSWNAPASVASFHVYRSTDGADFTAVATATNSATYDDGPLASFATYYYRVAPIQNGSDGTLSQTRSIVTYSLPPLMPLGITVTSSSSSVTIAWTGTTRFSDGTAFFSPTSTDELEGYNVYRSTSICGTPTLLTDLSSTTTSLNDNTGGQPYFYQLQAFNSVGASTETVLLDSLGSAYYVASDCLSRAVVPDALAPSLKAGNDGYSEDISVQAQLEPSQNGGTTYQTVNFTASLGGHTPLPSFSFQKPITVQLHYLTQNGSPIPDATLEAKASATPQAGVGDQDLGAYWNNGSQWQKMYGQVDSVDQLVSVQTQNVGTYQIRAQARSAGAVFDVSNISSRVITPNGDGLNDNLIFTFDPGPNGVVPEGKIYDVSGRYVSDMAVAEGSQTGQLTWDGRSGGRYVTSGVYIYQIKGDGKVFNGSIVVAR